MRMIRFFKDDLAHFKERFEIRKNLGPPPPETALMKFESARSMVCVMLSRTASPYGTSSIVQ